jgi:hypothetical protein
MLHCMLRTIAVYYADSAGMCIATNEKSKQNGKHKDEERERERER